MFPLAEMPRRGLSSNTEPDEPESRESEDRDSIPSQHSEQDDPWAKRQDREQYEVREGYANTVPRAAESRLIAPAQVSIA